MVRRSWLLLVLVFVCALGAVPALASAKPSLPFYAIGKTVIKVPKSVQPWLPVWSPNGRHVVFENQVNGTLWAASGAEHKVSCITCSFRDAPKIEGGFDYVFPDERRMFVSHGLGASGGIDSGSDADAWVLECEPSLYACRSHRYLPVDMSQDKVGNPVIVQRRTWHLAPDGIHLGWMEVRLGATLMIVGKMQREADKYEVVDQRVVDPPGPATLSATNPLGWANAGQLYELKSFADGGRSVLAVAEPQDNPDVVKINLATGHVTQLTHNLAWDEDGALSPDGQLYTVESARSRPGVQALGWIPQLEPFFAYPLAATIAVSGSKWIDYQCDLSPWLLPASGDDGGKLIGQPLETYPVSGNVTAGDQLAGQQMWSPDGTGVLMQETTREYPPKGSNPQISQIGLTPHRIVIAQIARRATKPLPAVGSTVGSWAPAPQNYHSTIASSTTVTLHGKGGGTALLSLRGSIAGGHWSVTYDHFSQDGKTFLDGTETAIGSPDATFTLDAAITVSGANTGSLHVALTYDDATATHAAAGYYHATYDGRVSPPIYRANRGCYRYLPHNTPLQVQIHHQSNETAVLITADIHGDDRPVSGAVVRLGSHRAVTGLRGQVTLPAPIHRARLTATAGYTFAPIRRVIAP